MACSCKVVEMLAGFTVKTKGSFLHTNQQNRRRKEIRLNSLTPTYPLLRGYTRSLQTMVLGRAETARVFLAFCFQDSVCAF